MSTEGLESEVETWLKATLKTDDVVDVSIELEGKNGKGAGYAGDVFFVQAQLVLKHGRPKTLNLALKCSKKSKALRDSIPMKQCFENEIHVYRTILPTLRKFEDERGILAPFCAVPRHFGSWTSADMELLVFENLRVSGFGLWDKRKPVTRRHIDLIVEQYGHLHALSAALAEQKPGLLEDITKGLVVISEEMTDTISFDVTLGEKIDQSCELLKGELGEEVLERWRNFKQQTDYIFRKLCQDAEFKVITHGDCWGNNFMYKYKSTDREILLEDVKMLDWQLSAFASPIMDLSYFLFASISEQDLRDLDAILDQYYASFSEHLTRLGSKAEDLYPYDSFRSDWRKFSRYGIMMCPLIYYICSTEAEEVLDIGEMAEQGEDFLKTFRQEIKDSSIFKSRMRTLIPFVVENNLI